MMIKRTILISYLLLVPFIVVNMKPSYGQELKRCNVKIKQPDIPKYRLGRTERIDETDSILIQISVNPQNVNREDLVKLASYLNKQFCKEKRFTVVIFDNPTSAKHFRADALAPNFEEGLESMRGEYYLDRTTGEEYINFSTVPNFFKSKESRVKVNLNLPLPK